MKKIVCLVSLAALLNGCSWFHHGDQPESSSGTGWIGGPDAGPGRGTTGVSSGASGGQGITGSDAAPPR
ncbi:MAG TPA: hypothetical protein VL793_12325 [Patescibacteria group bacterium]|jgi:hypothetical protein|nr:hypothetical protein [Patescibacteria group bacterium]